HLGNCATAVWADDGVQIDAMRFDVAGVVCKFQNNRVPVANAQERARNRSIEGPDPSGMIRTQVSSELERGQLDSDRSRARGSIGGGRSVGFLTTLTVLTVGIGSAVQPAKQDSDSISQVTKTLRVRMPAEAKRLGGSCTSDC
ncbi:MAG TPA: hypothetical protein VKP30_15470, partial [Polyangiaceae bacterium]|nr:hypothetical protein [Polyangiaceae bacterium]